MASCLHKKVILQYTHIVMDCSNVMLFVLYCSVVYIVCCLVCVMLSCCIVLFVLYCFVCVMLFLLCGSNRCCCCCLLLFVCSSRWLSSSSILTLIPMPSLHSSCLVFCSSSHVWWPILSTSSTVPSSSFLSSPTIPLPIGSSSLPSLPHR